MAFKIEIDGDFGSVEDKLRKMVETLNKELEQSGGKMTKDIEAMQRRLKDFQRAAYDERRGEIEKRYTDALGSGVSPRSAAAGHKADLKDLEAWNIQEVAILQSIHRQLIEQTGLQRDHKSTPSLRQTVGAIAGLMGLRELISTGVGYVDRRAGWNASTFGTTPGSNLVSAGEAGVDAGAGASMLLGAGMTSAGIIGILTASLTYLMKDASQKDEMRVQSANKIATSIASVSRFGVGAFGPSSFLTDRERGINERLLSSKNITDAQSMGVGYSGLLSGGEQVAKSQGILSGASAMDRFVNLTAASKGYGVDMDLSAQRYSGTDLLSINYKMLNVLTTISGKSGITADNTILASQKSAELNKIMMSQLSGGGKVSPDEAIKQLRAFQSLGLTPGDDRIAEIRQGFSKGISNQQQGALGYLQRMSMSQALQGMGMLSQSQDINYIDWAISQGLNNTEVPGLGMSYGRSFIQNVKKQTRGNEGLSFMRSVFGGNLDPRTMRMIFDNPSILSSGSLEEGTKPFDVSGARFNSSRGTTTLEQNAAISENALAETEDIRGALMGTEKWTRQMVTILEKMLKKL